MKASFLIGFHTARMDNLLQTLRFLVRDHSELIPDCQIVTVCQNNIEFQPWNFIKEFNDLRRDFLKVDHFDMELEEMMLPYVTNFGISNCDSEKVIILESDRILPAGYFASVIDQLKPKISITCKNMKKLKSPVTDTQIIENTFEYNDEDRSETFEIGRRNMWSGNTAIWRQDFLDVGQMDESYVGYGWADTDMCQKMKNFGVQPVFREEIELHLWHPQATYGSSDQKKLFLKNGLKYCQKWNAQMPEWFQKELTPKRFFL